MRLIFSRWHNGCSSRATRYLNDSTGIFGQHVVKSGDVLNDVARDYGISYQFMNMLRGRSGQGVEDGRLTAWDKP